MTNWSLFEESLKETMKLAKELDGVDSIHWDVSYKGSNESIRTMSEIFSRVCTEVNGNCSQTLNEGVA